MSTAPHTQPPSHHEIEFSVDGEKIETRQHELTAVQITVFANIDPKTHYLVEIEGHHQISYKDRPEAEIHLRAGLKFISVSTGPTPVS